MPERKLASVQKVSAVLPIEGADNIELVKVLGWQCVTAKADCIKEGDLVVYFEIDSVLPEVPEYEFLRKRCFVDNGVVKGFRIRTVKLRKQLSQGLVVPVSVIAGMDKKKEGDDVTKELNVDKYLRPDEVETTVVYKKKTGIKRIINNIVKKVFGYVGLRYMPFPSYIPQTDEIRIQSSPKLLGQMVGKRVHITEKLDGQSATYSLYNCEFRASSRTVTKYISSETFFGKLYKLSGLPKLFNKISTKRMARKYKIDSSSWMDVCKRYAMEERLRALGLNIAIQGEIIGPRIQGNKYRVNKNKFYVFNVFDIDEKSYLDPFLVSQVVERINQLICAEPVEEVPLLNIVYYEDIKDIPSLEEIILGSEIKSTIKQDRWAEGRVFKWVDTNGYFSKKSFKSINNQFLLEEK